MSKHDAILITETYLKNIESYVDFKVDSKNIIERDTLWYIPFINSNFGSDDYAVGVYHGLIVDKETEEYHQPGSAFPLEKWMRAFELGLLGKRYDLLIEKVNSHREALEVLEKLGLQYVKIELENGIEWKIPKLFNRKVIKKRLGEMPCIFKNQSFSFSVNEFEKIRNENIFKYQLLESKQNNPEIFGELIEK